jgi:hypothetical protein
MVGCAVNRRRSGDPGDTRDRGRGAEGGVIKWWRDLDTWEKSFFGTMTVFFILSIIQ